MMFEKRSKRSFIDSRKLLLVLLILLSPSLEAGEHSRLGIFIQSDSRGELRPCHCPGKTINSLGRRKGVFGMARALPYPVVVLDGGDTVPGPEDTLHTELGNLMVKAMSTMRYDAVALGERDLLPGPEFLKQLGASVPLVCSNLEVGTGLPVEIPPVRWIETEESRVAVIAYLDPLLFYTAPNAFDLYGDHLVLRDPVESLSQVMKTVRAEADVIILLAHASREEMDIVLEQVPGIDVVVQGHEPMDPHPGLSYGETLLMIPEPRSRQVSQLTIALTDPIQKQVARTWDLKETRYEDKRLDALVRSFEDRHGNP